MLQQMLGILASGSRRWTSRFRIARLLVNYQGNRAFGGSSVPPLDFLPRDELIDDALCDRLIRAYRAATAQGAAPPDGIWEGRAAADHQQLARLLLEGDCAGVARILSTMFQDPVTAGLALGKDDYEAARASDRTIRLLWHDKAIALGQACGVVATQNPEQGEWGTSLAMDSLDVLRRAARAIEIDPAPPQVGAMFGARLDGKVVPVHHLMHLYTAHRLGMLVELNEADVLEIGGGVGLLAYATASAGARSFTIVDLPLVNALQGYLLLRSALADRVELFGEEQRSGSRAIRILPNCCIDRLQPKAFDVVVNQDSLPEMATETMHGYLRAIPRLSRRFFLSINQEARTRSGEGVVQGWVHDACRGIDSLRLAYRAPYWLRRGYVEELYRVEAG
jgi:hypothetical protein